MKLVVDENIVQAKDAFNTFGKVIFLNGRKITNEILKDVDALIIRSITKVNKELLQGTNVKFVGTATIGTDHIDIEYLNNNNIQFSSASGCNSYSVAEYVFSALTYFADKYDFDISKKSIGIIGYGNIGTKVVKIAKALGMKTLINDPPLEREKKQNVFSSLEEALKCDIVTFHVPLNTHGVDKTVHLLNEKNISLIKNDAILINTSRGPVISNNALKKRLRENKNIRTVLDVWETEPNFDAELLELVEIGTPHIAGYSFEGKITGTLMIYEALSEFLNSPKNWRPFLDVIPDNKIVVENNDTFNIVLKKLFDKSYKITDDDKLMRENIDSTKDERAKHFDSLRKNYRMRRELNNFEVILNIDNGEIRNLLNVLRVKIIK